jgi:phosphohistidine phosphatase SixA
MIDYNKPPLGYLVRAASSDLDSPLDLSGRERAEAAAQFLSFEKIGQIVSTAHAAAIETAEIIFQDCVTANHCPEADERLEDPDQICGYMIHGFPSVVITTQKGIQAAIARLMPGANVCQEIVAPGGVISIHRVDGKILVRARTMILDFTFTEFVEAVCTQQI